MVAPALRIRQGLLLSSRQPFAKWPNTWVPSSIVAPPAPSGVQYRCQSAAHMMKAIAKRREKKMPSTSPRSQKQETPRSLDNRVLLNMILPSTFIRPPFSHFPRQPRAFFRFTYIWLSQKLRDSYSLLAYKMTTMPKFYKRPRFKIDKRGAIAAAKALQMSMNDALARGDKGVLHRVCTRELYTRLCVAIENRPLGKRYGWKLVRYRKRWAYPRLLDDKVSLMPNQTVLFRQVVVAIASRQRRVEYDDTPTGGGRVVPGSEKEVDLLEYLVMQTSVDYNTGKQGDWLLFGTVKASSLEEVEKELVLLKKVEAEEAEKFKRFSR